MLNGAMGVGNGVPRVVSRAVLSRVVCEVVGSVMNYKMIMKALGIALLLRTVAQADTPAFNCKAKELSSAEKLICEDEALIALDHELNSVFEKARALDKKVVGGALLAEQRGWIKGRNDCWKESDLRACIVGAYRRRTAELQAKYRLLSPIASVPYSCDGNPAHELIVSFFPTTLKTAVVEHGDDTFILFDDSNGAGRHFTGRNETLAVSENGVDFVGQYEGPTVSCVARQKKQSRMHPSWDKDGDGVNDCETDGTCDDSVDYSRPRT
jgi:uncharacterized protein